MRRYGGLYHLHPNPDTEAGNPAAPAHCRGGVFLWILNPDYQNKLELMREWESNLAKYLHLYKDFQEFVQLKRYGSTIGASAWQL